MNNKEDILNVLEEYEAQKPKDIPRELEDYLNLVAKTGDPIFVWPKVKFLFQQKLQQVLCDYYESCPNNDILQCPNVDQFNFDVMRNKILERLESFASAPFTIQRLSELLTCPRKEYNRTDKFMRAVEKNILVVTTREPGNMPRGDAGVHVVNGVMDQRGRHEPMDIDDHPSASRCELTSVSCGSSSGKPINGMDDDDVDDDDDDEEEASEEDDDEESNSQEAIQQLHQESQNSTSDHLSNSPDRENSKSPIELSQINGMYKTQESTHKSKIVETESSPPETNFNADKLAESSESSSSLPSENSEQYNAACQDFSSSSDENYQDSNPICETPSETDIDCDPEAVENIRLPPEPYKGPQPITILASTEETSCVNTVELSDTTNSDDVQMSEPPSKRMREGKSPENKKTLDIVIGSEASQSTHSNSSWNTKRFQVIQSHGTQGADSSCKISAHSEYTNAVADSGTKIIQSHPSMKSQNQNHDTQLDPPCSKIVTKSPPPCPSITTFEPRTTCSNEELTSENQTQCSISGNPHQEKASGEDASIKTKTIELVRKESTVSVIPNKCEGNLESCRENLPHDSGNQQA